MAGSGAGALAGEHLVRLAVSPDADDLFMVRALLEGALETPGTRWAISSSPTDALNEVSSGGDGPEVVAISVAHYPRVADRYQLLPHGGSMGEGYGPVLVARSPRSLREVRRLAVPGLTTTAWLVTRILFPELVAEPVVIPISPYERTFQALDAGEVDCALVIHEGRLTYPDPRPGLPGGFVKLADLGEAWADRFGGLPLPLGANAIRRDLGPARIAELSGWLRASIAHALADRPAAIAWLLRKGSALGTPERVDAYLGMYANQRTLDYGPDGRDAIRLLFALAAERGLLPPVGEVDFAP